MGRKILVVTSDEQRYDALGCYGGRVARTPNLDRLAATGIRYERAYAQNVTCMPARSTIITGQHVATHGVYRNGYSLPEDDPCVARYLREKGSYRTALIGKAHWQPMTDHSSWEASAALRGDHGPYRGFEYLSLAAHSGIPYRCTLHYNRWLADHGPQYVECFYPPVGPKGGPNNRKGGDTNAIQVHFNACPREFYHTDWVSDQSIQWLRSLGAGDDWFLWVSFPDPHHPFDPPLGEKHRINWRDLDLPAGHPGSEEKVRKILASKPKHWLNFYLGRADVAEETPDDFVPASMTKDNVREINAMVHVQNELIDEALFPAESADGLPKHRQISQELRIESNELGRFDWQAGVFWFDERITVDSFSYDTLAPGNPQNGYLRVRQTLAAQYRPEREWEGQKFVHDIGKEGVFRPFRIPGFEARDTGVHAATKGVASVMVARPSGVAGSTPAGTRRSACSWPGM